MSYLLDTNVLSEIRKGERAAPSVIAWLAAARDTDLFVSSLVLGELRQGVESTRRRDPLYAVRLDDWLSKLGKRYAGRVLAVDHVIADTWGRLNVPNRLPAVDGLLAATALVHDLILVTRNTKDMIRTGVRTLNPFDA